MERSKVHRRSSCVAHVERAPSSLVVLLCLYVVVLPLNAFSLLNLGSRGVLRPDWLVGLALVGVFGVHLLGRRIRLQRSSAAGAAALYVVTSLVSGVALFNAATDQMVDFATKGVQIVMAVAVFTAISNSPLDRSQFNAVLRTWFVVALTVALFAGYQLLARRFDWPLAILKLSNPSVARRGPTQTGRYFQEFGYAQVSSFFKEPTFLGSYLLSATVFFGLVLLRGRDALGLFRPRMVSWVGVALMALGLLIAAALGPYLSLIGLVGVLGITGGLFTRPFVRLTRVILVALAFAGLLLPLAGIDFFSVARHRTERLWASVQGSPGGSAGTSYNVRRRRALSGLGVWARRPMLGVGLNNSRYHMGDNVESINNGWVQLLAEQGLLGLLTIVALVLLILGRLRSLCRQPETGSDLAGLAFALYALLIVDSLDTLVTFNWAHPLRWFSLSLAHLACTRLSHWQRKVKKRAGIRTQAAGPSETRGSTSCGC